MQVERERPATIRLKDVRIIRFDAVPTPDDFEVERPQGILGGNARDQDGARQPFPGSSLDVDDSPSKREASPAELPPARKGGVVSRTRINVRGARIQVVGQAMGLSG